MTENYRNFYKSSDLLNLKSELYVYRLGLSYAVLIKLKYIVVKELNVDLRSKIRHSTFHFEMS